MLSLHFALIAFFVVFRLMGLYQYLHHRIHSPARPLKILFHVGMKETVLGWVSHLHVL
jgi:hypothetical protein